MTSVRLNQPYVSPAVQNPTFPTVHPDGIRETGFCPCGYPQPCTKTVPIAFCTGGGMLTPKDDKIAKFVNELRDIAIKYHATQQLQLGQLQLVFQLRLTS